MVLTAVSEGIRSSPVRAGPPLYRPALWMTQSMGRAAALEAVGAFESLVFELASGLVSGEEEVKAFASAASFFVSAMLERSPMRTVSAPGQACRAASARWALRACRMTVWPRRMSWRAAREPRPSAEPVMRMRAMICLFILFVFICFFFFFFFSRGFSEYVSVFSFLTYSSQLRS